MRGTIFWEHLKNTPIWGVSRPPLIQPQTDLERLPNKISNGTFADDLICLSTKITDLCAQAEKLSFYSDRAALIVSLR